MTSTNFSADTSVLIYTAISVFLCVLVYKAASWLRFDWNAKGMNNVMGSGRIHQVDSNGEDPARNAAVSIGNVTNSMTPAHGASLLVLVFFLFGAFMGTVAIPAALGMMSEITTLNILALMVAGVAWGMTLGRLTVSFTVVLIQIAVVGVVLVVLLYAVNFAFTFLNGGRDFFWDRTMSQVDEVTKTLRNYDHQPKGTWFHEYEKHRQRNLCAVYEGIATKGNIEATLKECDRTAWVIDQNTKEMAWKMAREENAKNEKKRFMTAYKNTFELLSAEFEEKAVPLDTKKAIGTWIGTINCNSKDVQARIIFEGDASNLHGVVQIIHSIEPSMADQNSAYRFTGTQEGEIVSLRAGDWIKKGPAGLKRDLKFRLHIPNRFKTSALDELNPPKDCALPRLRSNQFPLIDWRNYKPS